MSTEGEPENNSMSSLKSSVEGLNDEGLLNKYIENNQLENPQFEKHDKLETIMQFAPVLLVGIPLGLYFAFYIDNILISSILIMIIIAISIIAYAINKEFKETLYQDSVRSRHHISSAIQNYRDGNIEKVYLELKDANESMKSSSEFHPEFQPLVSHFLRRGQSQDDLHEFIDTYFDRIIIEATIGEVKQLRNFINIYEELPPKNDNDQRNRLYDLILNSIYKHIKIPRIDSKEVLSGLVVGVIIILLHYMFEISPSISAPTLIAMFAASRFIS